MTFRTSDKNTKKYFDKREVSVSIHRVEFDNRTLRYVRTGQEKSLPLLIFVHGAPGSADAFHSYLADSVLLQHFRMVSMDRLGYGYSGFGDADTSLLRQAQSIKPVLEQHAAGESVFLVGHSYGGPIIGRFAMEFPDLVDGLLMLAPANDPDHEKIFWFSYLGIWQPFRFLTPTSMKVAADEKFSHRTELEKMASLWKNLGVPTIHVHGKKDTLVPFENLAFSEKHIPDNLLRTVVLEKGSHFIPWTEKELVLEQLEALKQWVASPQKK